MEEEQDDSVPKIKHICLVCQKQFANYACPRCNTRYCSLNCYKSHSGTCTEAFYRENVEENLHNQRATPEERKRLAEALQRVHLGTQSEDDEEDSCVSEEESDAIDHVASRVLEGADVSLEELPPEQRRAFLRSVAAGKLSHLIEYWEPWWCQVAVADWAKKQTASSLVQDPENAGTLEEAMAAAVTAGMPRLPKDLPDLKSLVSRPVSPQLRIHLAEILFSYCFTVRYFNGDWGQDPVGASDTLLGISPALRSPTIPQTLDASLGACMESACSPKFRAAGGWAFCLTVISDVKSVVKIGKFAVLCLLGDAMDMLAAAMEEARKVGSGRAGERRRTQKSRPRPEGGSGVDRDVSEGSELTLDDAVRETVETNESLLGVKWVGQVAGSSAYGASVAQLGGVGAEGAGGRGQLGSGQKLLKFAEKKVVFFASWVKEEVPELFEILLQEVSLHLDSEKLAFEASAEATGAKREASKVVAEHSRALIEDL